jgi:putative tryptophan/tyrosine transport system substrate-binding protein
MKHRIQFLRRRREFITLIGGAAAWPRAARAQQMPVIGYLGGESRESETFKIVPFRQGLKEAGYIDGQNVTIEYRWAEDQYDRLPALAADLVRRQVTVIVLDGIAPALAGKAATTTIPMVFEVASDPVQIGLVANLNRPGGNLTGVTSLNAEVGPKRLELLHELVPTATAIALLVNPTSPDQTESTTRDAEAAARRLGLKLYVLHASTERDFDTVFATLVQLRAGALVIGPDLLFANHREQLGALTIHHAVPAISPYREFAAAGGLISYGTSITDLFRQVRVYTGRILKGEKPADLPVQQATKVELLINFKTARALGLTVPLPLLGRTDEVIE